TETACRDGVPVTLRARKLHIGFGARVDGLQRLPLRPSRRSPHAHPPSAMPATRATGCAAKNRPRLGVRSKSKIFPRLQQPPGPTRDNVCNKLVIDLSTSARLVRMDDREFAD